MFKQFLTATALGAAILSPAAYARDSAIPQGTVSFADLDLSTEAGVKALDARIDREARQICKVNDHITGSKIVPQDRLECYKKAKSSAKSQMAVHIMNAQRGG